MNMSYVVHWELLTEKKLRELIEGEKRSVLEGVGAGQSLLETGHLRKDLDDMRS